MGRCDGSWLGGRTKWFMRGGGSFTSPRVLRASELYSRQLTCAGENQPMVSALGSKLEQQQPFLPSCRRLAFAGHRPSFHLAESGLRSELRQPRWLQPIARPEHHLSARHRDQPDVREHLPLPIRTAWTALRLLATSS